MLSAFPVFPSKTKEAESKLCLKENVHAYLSLLAGRKYVEPFKMCYNIFKKHRLQDGVVDWWPTRTTFNLAGTRKLQLPQLQTAYISNYFATCIWSNNEWHYNMLLFIAII